ncbi:MAG: hypothetical protein HDS23_00775 [Bacteroides sp.]|nr:hypothetical protein [Bacteroidales bacterium]MBD5291772.1 hypothetical protein [Bacteroides sp.]
MMKSNLLFGLAISGLLLSSQDGLAQTNIGGNNDAPIVVIKLPIKPKPNPTLRPKAPSMQDVTCTYNEGMLTFEFAYPEGECELQLTDLSTGEMILDNFDSAISEPVYVGYHSTASLTVTTANGNIYSGGW